MAVSAKNIIKFTWKLLLLVFLFLMLFISFFYLNTTIYSFPEPQVFKGEKLYNPYENLPDSSYRANFHAHSIAWQEVTNGHNTEKDLFDEYTKRGYDIAGISNYHSISEYGKTRGDLYIPVYEHGFNIFKSHYLSISPDDVSFLDYPLWQLTSHKQKIIQRLKENNAVVAMAHPKFGGGRTMDDMRNLVNYEFTEVLNHYRTSDEYWDEALSAGRLTWVMGNDDTHDILNEPTFQIWNIIHSEVRNSDSVLNSMVAGKNYAIKSNNTLCDNSLVRCTVENDSSLSVVFENIVNKIEFIGQDGKLKKTDFESKTGKYTFDDSDTYIRIVAKNHNSSIYLNPIVRYDGITVPLNTNLAPTSSFLLTWVFRLFILLISIGILILMRKIIRK